MGVLRKAMSVHTLGLIDYKSDKERIAASSRKGKNAQRKTNKLLKEQNRLLREQQSK